MNIIILTLNSNVVNNIENLINNKESPSIDIDSIMSFIFYSFYYCENFNDALRYSIETYRDDVLLNDPGVQFKDNSNSLNIFKKLVTSLYSNLEQYGITINDKSSYDFSSFITKEDIVLKQT